MKRIFRRFRDDRFALTTLQNPNIEVRTYAELVQAAQQERENQPGAAQVAATQPLAAPDAPDPIPTTEIRVNDASTAPDPDSANPDSTSEDAQQILESLVAGVVAAGSSLPSLPSLSSDDDELAAPPTPKPRHKTKKRPKSKSRRKPKPSQHPALARALAFLSTTDNNDATAPQDDQPDEIQDPEQDESHEPTPLERHTRKCSICNHPHREYIEEAFLQWRSPDTIKSSWDISSRTTIYHHAHAFNLFALRNRNLQLVLGNIIENADNRHFTAREILDAIRVLAHVNEGGRWVHPTSKSEVIYSMQRLPAVAGLPAGQASLPAAQAGLPAVPGLPAKEGLPAAAGLPTGHVGEPILIATQLLNTDAND
jgi:hypothetical protein